MKTAKLSIALLLDYYDYLVRNHEITDKKTAAALEIGINTFNKYARTLEFQIAKQKAEARRKVEGETLGNYVLRQLSPEAQEAWQQIEFWSEHTDADKQIQAIVGGKCQKLRQELFIHALVTTNFSMSKACRLTCVSIPVLDHWRSKDPQFRQLVEEIQIHKKNYFEERLVQLVDEGHPGAVIFVNRTINADRGYSEKLQIEHSGGIQSAGFTIDDLDLDIDTRRKVLAAIRKRTKEDTEGVQRPVLDVETEDTGPRQLLERSGAPGRVRSVVAA